MPEANLPAEQDAAVFKFEQFGTLNTKANRPSIKDEEFAWNENWMPIGDGNLRVLYAEDSAIYNTTGNRTILNAVPFNFGNVSYAAVFLDNGTAVQVNLGNGTQTTIASGNHTFYDGTSLPAASQWEAKYLLIASQFGNSTNGYFLWDGSHLFQAGTLSPDVTITNAGANYTSAPSVTAFGGSGSGATFAATQSNGNITSVKVVNPGTGYLATDGVIQLAFSGGGSDTSAQAVANITTTGGVAAIEITNSGFNYTTNSTITFSGGSGSGASAVITGLVSGAITQITITNPGTGYTSAPSFNITGGSNFTGQVDMRYGQVANITVSANGTGYHTNPQVIISAPDSLSLPTVQATAIATVSGGAISNITVTQAGLGYTKAPTVTLVGGNNAAAGTVNLMPFGIQGTTIETYQNAAWVGNSTKISFTAPGTTSNFATSAGGGSFQSTDNFLRDRFVCLKQTNGFLYLIGDSSINVISNVQTTVANGVSTTTFNNSNVDPQTGTPWRDSVTVFGRAIVFANSSGVYALYGGAAEKVSGPLDGLFADASFNTGGNGATPSSAVATIFGIRCFLFLFTTVNPVTGGTETLMCAWDGQKWWPVSQVNTMDLIATSETNSVLTAYGATLTSLYPMLTTPSANLTKTFQTRLRPDPTSIMTKQVNRLYVVAETTAGNVPSLSVSVDTEKGTGSAISLTVAGILQFTGLNGQPITFVGSGPIVWTTSGLSIAETSLPAVYGRFIGVTASTTAEQFTLLELDLLSDNTYAPNA